MSILFRLLMLGMALFPISSFAKRPLDCSVNGGLHARCYDARPTPELRVALVYYGEYWTPSDLVRFEAFLQTRFLEMTKQVVSLKVVGSRTIPFRYKMRRGYQYNQITDPARLQRIWYWQSIGTSVGEEIYYEYLNDEVASTWENIDLILAVTGAQFDGAGLGASAVVAVEHPRENAWGLEDGGSVDLLTDAQIADVLIHEMGHSLSLGHANDQCADEKMSAKESYDCCQKSPSRNDVMGYCRDRSKKRVNETSFNGFEACTLNILKSKVVPRLLEGGPRKISEEIHCE